jgi:hypothetical protein
MGKAIRHRVDLRVAVHAPRVRKRRRYAKRAGKLKKCAYAKCEVRFKPVIEKGVERKYCSRACCNRDFAQNQDARNRGAETNRERIARRKAEAAACGMTTDELLEARIDAYWRKVEDPNYYTGLRGVTSQSTLRGAL